MVAHDIYTGELLWAYQAHPGDSLDFDFCAHPVIVDAAAPARGRGDMRPCVVAGTKAGIFCVNRYTGHLYWKVMLGQPSGGSGARVDAIAHAHNKIYVQYSSPTSVPAMAVTAALNAYTGDIEWITPNPAQSTSPIAIANDLLYQGYVVKGKIEALDVLTGRRVWEYPLPGDYRGGASIANGALYTSNGEVEVSRREDKTKGYNYSLYCFTIDGV
jgi:glucose dehydrogenase